MALAAALVALGVAAAWSRALLRGRGAVRGLELRKNEALVELGSGEKKDVTVAPRRYVSRLFVSLTFGAAAFHRHGGRTLLVTADMLDRHEFRRLRVWALWGKAPDVAGEQLAG